MIPATLVQIPNYPGFLGTFDHATWWKSEAIDDLDEIIAVCWVYGEYHICAAKMRNGTYSVWQSPNNGYSWREQLNIPDRIYAIVRPDYGQVIISTSAGWYKSNNSGTDWTLVSTQAKGCHTVKELTGDVLVALDGTYIWRSADSGANWTKAVKKGTATPVTAITNYPSIDGTYTDCFCGCTGTNIPLDFTYLGFSGPFSQPTVSGDIGVSSTYCNWNYKDIMLYSDDGGTSFTRCGLDSGWSFREAQCTVTDFYTSTDPYFAIGNGWEGWYNGMMHFKMYLPAMPVPNLFPRSTYNDVITDIEMTGINENGLPQFVIQVLMPSGLCRHWWVRRIVNVGSEAKQLWSIARFDSNATPGKSIESSQVNIAGTEDYLLLATFAGMNTSGQPMLKTSDDGGKTWEVYDPSTASVYQEPELTNESDNPFLDDAYVKLAWNMPRCHNGWRLVSDHYEKFQSYDMGATISSPWVTRTSTYTASGNIEGETVRTYRMTGRKTAIHTSDYSCEGLLGEDKTSTYDASALIQTTVRITYRMKWLREDSMTASYAMSGTLMRTRFPTIITPQAFNVHFPWSSEMPIPFPED